MRSCFRLGCLLVLLLVALVVGFFVWRGRAEPSAFREQQAQRESHSPQRREELIAEVETRLRRAFSSPVGERAPEVAAPPAAGGPEAPPLPTTPPGPPPAQAARKTEASPAPDERRPLDRRRVTLSLEQINALLEERASRWTAQAGGRPLPVAHPLLTFEGDHWVLFTQLDTPAGQLLLGVPFELEVDEHGGVVQLLGVRLGQLPLPGLESLPRLLRAAKDPRLDRLAEKAESAANGYTFDPLLPHDGGALRVVGVELDPDAQAVHLTLAAD